MSASGTRARIGRSLCSAFIYPMSGSEPIRGRIYVLAKNARALYTKRGFVRSRLINDDRARAEMYCSRNRLYLL